jgi:hypothetical protein
MAAGRAIIAAAGRPRGAIKTHRTSLVKTKIKDKTEGWRESPIQPIPTGL